MHEAKSRNVYLLKMVEKQKRCDKVSLGKQALKADATYVHIYP